MPMSDDDKKEFISLMADGMAAGLAKFRSETEEEAAKAKAQQEEDAKKEGGKNDDNNKRDRFSFGGFLLGG